MGCSISKWATLALEYFASTEDLCDLLFTIIGSVGVFMNMEKEIKFWLRQGLPSKDQIILQETDISSPTEEKKKERATARRKLNRLFNRLKMDMFPLSVKPIFDSSAVFPCNPDDNEDTVVLPSNLDDNVDDFVQSMDNLIIEDEKDKEITVPKPVYVPVNVESPQVIVEEEDEDGNDEDVEKCFVCLKECVTTLKTCSHYIHLKCKTNMMNHNLIKCGICDKPFCSPREISNISKRRYGAIVNIIIHKLSVNQYDYESVCMINDFLEE